jgi:glucan phosphoethanolaminetransferase (alkaline phosphatase superfamily)
MRATDLEELFVRDARTNAVIVWLLAAVLLVVAAGAVLGGSVPGAALAALAAFVAIAPAVVRRSWTAAVPWPLLLLASLPLWLSALRPSLSGVFVTGISVAALAMLVVVVLQLLTRVRMTPTFAVFFVTIAALATAGFWAVGAAVSARYLGTAFVSTNDELMLVFTATVLAGLLAGGVFLAFFRRTLRANAGRTPGGGTT